MNQSNKEKIKVSAFHDWLEGMTHKEISKKYNVSVRTIDKWAIDRNWSGLKAKAIERANNSIAVKFEKRILEGGEMFIDIALQIGRLCKDKLQERQENGIDGISDIVNIAFKAVQIFKGVMPDASESLAKSIANDLQELKRKQA